MVSELQRRLMERRERQEFDRMLRAAPEAITACTLASAEVPDGVLEVVRGFWSMSAEPAATLNDRAATGEFEQLLASLLEDG